MSGPVSPCAPTDADAHAASLRVLTAACAWRRTRAFDVGIPHHRRAEAEHDLAEAVDALLAIVEADAHPDLKLVRPEEPAA